MLLDKNCTVEQLADQIVKAIAILPFLNQKSKARNEKWLLNVLKEFEEQVVSRERKKP